MTLTRRIALFIAALLLLALGGALVIQTLAARAALLAQQDLRNRDGAATLALAMSQHEGEVGALRALAAAQFDQGHFRRIRLVDPAGAVLFAFERPVPELQRPRWFGRLLPMDGADGRALVSAGWRERGTLEVAGQSAWAQQALWQASVDSALLLALLALLAAGATAAMLRAWQRPLLATVAQARALAEGRFVEAPLPSLPELQTVARSMNTTVRRLRETFAQQAGQVAYLQRQAQLDGATGLPLAAAWTERLEQRLRDGGSAVGVVRVRVAGLDRLNAQGGRDAADRLLRGLGDAVARTVAAEPDSAATRLGGTDLALLLPVPGLAAALAPGLLERLRAVVAAADGAAAAGVEVALAVVEGGRGWRTGGGATEADARGARGTAGDRRDKGASDAPGAPDGAPGRDERRAAGIAGAADRRAPDGAGDSRAAVLLAAAADAVARAARSPGRCHVDAAASAVGADADLAWRQARVRDALAAGRTALAQFAVRDATGALLHLECPLRLRLDPAGALESAAAWLPLARRAGVLPQVDETAVALALQAIGDDGRPRAVNVERSSLAAPGFVEAVGARLARAPAAARSLWIEWRAADDGDGDSAADAVAWHAAAHAAAAWHAHGVRLGVEHAGGAPEQLARWRETGLDYVKVAGTHLRGIAHDGAARAYAGSLAGLVRLLGLKALAEGIDDADDLRALWALGFDGATGRAVASADGGGTDAAGAAAAPTGAPATPGTAPTPSARTAASAIRAASVTARTAAKAASAATRPGASSRP